MALHVAKISNPLTLIAVFASLAEIAATAALPTLNDKIQGQFVWFVMLFPVLLVVLFFLTLNFNNRVLYAPGDYADEENFVRLVGAARIDSYGPPSSAVAALRAFWKPNDQIDRDNETRLRGWMSSNGLGELSITAFLFGKKFDNLHSKAATDLHLI